DHRRAGDDLGRGQAAGRLENAQRGRGVTIDLLLADDRQPQGTDFTSNSINSVVHGLLEQNKNI
ncbi:MAG: hypothetical protein JSV48_13625, partial [Bradyrhizobium sp.]